MRVDIRAALNIKWHSESSAGKFGEELFLDCRFSSLYIIGGDIISTGTR